MSVTAVNSRRLEIGAVVNDTFKVLKRRGKDVGLATALLVVLPVFVNLGIRLVFRQSGGLSLTTLVLSALTAVIGIALQGALFYLATRELDGKRASLEDMLRIGFKVCLPMVALTILVFLAVEIGLLLVIVPGVFLFLRWCVSGPAMVAENLGIFRAMKRSAELTKGRRWATLLASLIILVVYVVIYGAFVVMAGGLQGMMALSTRAVATPLSIIMLTIVSPILSIVLSIGTALFFAALYHQLRGPADATVEAMAEVFA